MTLRKVTTRTEQTTGATVVKTLETTALTRRSHSLVASALATCHSWRRVSFATQCCALFAPPVDMLRGVLDGVYGHPVDGGGASTKAYRDRVAEEDALLRVFLWRMQARAFKT